MHLTQAPKILFFPPSNLTCTTTILYKPTNTYGWVFSTKKDAKCSDTYSQQEESPFHFTYIYQ